MLVIRYTAGRVPSTVTPPHRVLLTVEFAFRLGPDNTNTIINPKLSTGHRAQLPHTLDETEKDNHGRKRSRHTVTSGNSSRPRLSTSPTSPTLNNRDTHGAYNY